MWCQRERAKAASFAIGAAALVATVGLIVFALLANSRADAADARTGEATAKKLAAEASLGEANAKLEAAKANVRAVEAERAKRLLDLQATRNDKMSGWFDRG
jgi:hypothetical protein